MNNCLFRDMSAALSRCLPSLVKKELVFGKPRVSIFTALVARVGISPGNTHRGWDVVLVEG